MESRDQAFDESHSLALALANAADDRKGINILIYKVADVTFITDYFVIVSGSSRTQVRALGDYLEDDVEAKIGRSPLRKAPPAA